MGAGGTRPVVYLGDSHVAYIKAAADNRLFAPRSVSGCMVPGATAVGMRNPNALTNALAQFRDFVAGKPRDAIVVTHLGEVDCGYVIWYRAQKYAEPVDDQLEQSIASYAGFVDELRASGFAHIVITGATLPTIDDGVQVADVALKRKGIRTSQRERTALTLRYNARLREEADRRGLFYAEITPDALDTETGLVRADYLNRDPRDHHMNIARAAVAWAARLNACFDTIDSGARRRCTWRAVSDTVVKALPVLPEVLPDALKVSVPEGARLTARLDWRGGPILAVSDAVLDGRPIDDVIRILRAVDWVKEEKEGLLF